MKITVGYFREVLHQYDKAEISISRLVELLNEKAAETPAPSGKVYSREDCPFVYCDSTTGDCKANNKCHHSA
jgi:hypothetical protein